MQIEAYDGEDGSNTHIYVDGRGKVVVNTLYSPSARKADVRHNFTMGDDGRLHVAGDYQRVLRVDGDGYLYAGEAPDEATSRNGVFEYDGRHHLIHAEDRKLLTVGLSSYTPFVDSTNHAPRCDWKLHKPDGTRAVPPRTNMHTFYGLSAGSPSKLYFFDQDPDTALPETATHFVTAVPNNPNGGNFLDYESRITPIQARDAAHWLRQQNAAWLFKDGYYAVSERPDQLEVRKLDGTPVWRAEAGASQWASVTTARLTELSSNYRMRAETWQRVQESERRRERVVIEVSDAGRVGH